MDADSIEEAVLKAIKPSKEEYEHVLEVFERIASVVRDVLHRHGVDAEVTLQGSIAHDTWLSGDRDMDIFVLYPESWSTEDLKSKGFKLLVEAAEMLGQYELRYAEHPYVRVRVEDVEADIVPAFNLSDPSRVKTAVDRTPFHTRYVREKLTPEMRDQVRLLKKFMKGIGVYGAEVKTRGFSGYAAEVLIAVYGSMRRVIEGARRWSAPVYIDTLGIGLDNPFWKAFKRKYPDSVMYTPDPVDPMRNVTANVSLRSLAVFTLASRCYLTNPSMVFYDMEEHSLEIEELKRALKGRCIVLVEYSLDEKLPPDVVWGEIYRTRDALVNLLSNLDFQVVDASAWSDEDKYCGILVELESCMLPVYKHYKGPSVRFEDRAVNFLRKHLANGVGVWIDEKGSLNSLAPRKHFDVVSTLEERYLEYSVAPHLRGRKPIIRMLSGDIIEELSRRGALKWVSEFILKTPTWMAKCIS